MKKLVYLTLILLLFVTVDTQGQTMINGLVMNSIDLEINGQAVDKDGDHNRLVIPYTLVKIMVYQDNDLTYWVEFDYRQCGKKAKLTGKTYVELSDGKIDKGLTRKTKYKIEENQPGWFVGFFDETFEINDGKDIAFKASFGYDLRYN